jgi:hypothetical protein
VEEISGLLAFPKNKCPIWGWTLGRARNLEKAWKKLGFTVGTKFTAEGRDQSYQRGDLRGRAPGYPSHMVPRHPSVVVQAMGAQA